MGSLLDISLIQSSRGPETVSSSLRATKKPSVVNGDKKMSIRQSISVRRPIAEVITNVRSSRIIPTSPIRIDGSESVSSKSIDKEESNSRTRSISPGSSFRNASISGFVGRRTLIRPVSPSFIPSGSGTITTIDE